VEDAIQSQIARMFYKGQKQSSGRSSILSRDATEINADGRRRDKTLRQKSTLHLRAGEIS
jgi:hypothetical protein